MMLCKAVAPAMKRQGQGRIVNIASIAGIYPGGSSIAYAVSKAGLIHLTKCMAVALAPHTLVNCVAPGCWTAPVPLPISCSRRSRPLPAGRCSRYRRIRTTAPTRS